MDEEEEKEHQFEGEESIDADKLPTGFRFRPTDKEIVADYLLRKIRGQDIPWIHPVADVELSKYHPDGLTEKYAEQGKDGAWYFFTPRVNKYPKGKQADRSAVGGYWKATEADKSIGVFLDGRVIGKITGLKKTLVFFDVDRADGDRSARRNMAEKKTAWTMYEYRIKEFMQSSSKTKFQDYVLCKIYRSKRSKGANDNNLQLQHYPLAISQPLPLAMAETLTEQPGSSDYVPFSVEFPELFRDGYADGPAINSSALLPGNERAAVLDRDIFEFLNCLPPPAERLQGLPSVDDQKFDVTASHEHAVMELSGHSVSEISPTFF